MIDRRALRVVVAATAAMLVLGQVAVGSAARLTDRAHAALPTAACGSTWSPVPSPSVFNTHGLFNWNALLSASATSASDVWAVGEDADATVYVAIGRTLTMHWDGTSWTPVKAVEVAGGNTYLSGVVAVAPNLVYAVGASKSDKVRGALIEAYDGSAWSVSRLPTIGSESVLFSVAASGAKDVWAVGEYIGDTTRTESLTLHSDGKNFQRVSADRSVAGTNRLYGVATINPKDAWAVGVVEAAGPAQTLTEHWDGTAWTRVPSPSIDGSRNSLLTSVSAISANDVWAVGQFDAADGTLRPLIEHWDGAAWSVIPSATPKVANARLFNVVAISATDAWAVGSFLRADVNQAFGMHWDGRKWSEADMSRGAVTPPTHLYGLAKTPTGELWAVGRRDLLTLTEHVCTQAATTTSLVVHPSRPSFGQSVTFTATVAPAAPSSTSPAGTVEFLLDGQAVPVATMDLVGGQASFTTSGLSAGPHTVTARYSGDANYAPSSSAPARITVTTTTRLSGDHPGALTVASGTSVLVANATIGGAVIVQPGGSVDIENSTVASLSAVGPGALRVCGSTVNGSVSVTQALGFVLIGDPGDDGCAANTIGGTVVVQDNHHGVEVIGNHVPAPVVAGANSGAGAFPEDTKPDISGNGPA